MADDVDGNCKSGCERRGYVEVCLFLVLSGLEVLTYDSSVVLWVSQNMEDEYAYNLAL
jgi:hypothetical protein